MSADTQTSTNLTPEQSAAILGLGRMFLIVHKTGLIYNHKTNQTQSGIDYVNGVLAACGIEAVFRPPPEERDPKTLRVVSQAGEPLEGKVTRQLEQWTRSSPDDVVQAVLQGGWWKRATGRDRGSVPVRVHAASDVDAPVGR